MFRSVVVAVVLISCAYVAVAQTPTAQCFQFTWLGPRYDNESIFMNATCQDATRLSSDIPCQEPLVVSEDGTWPDIHHIWENHREGATCSLASTHVCAQYTYFFDGNVVNSTYMCTQAIDQLGNAITSGCFQQRVGSFETRVCFCRSVIGMIPCNGAVVSSVAHTSIFLILFALMFRGAGVFGSFKINII